MHQRTKPIPGAIPDDHYPQQTFVSQKVEEPKLATHVEGLKGAAAVPWAKVHREAVHRAKLETPSTPSTPAPAPRPRRRWASAPPSARPWNRRRRRPPLHHQITRRCPPNHRASCPSARRRPRPRRKKPSHRAPSDGAFALEGLGAASGGQGRGGGRRARRRAGARCLWRLWRRRAGTCARGLWRVWSASAGAAPAPAPAAPAFTPAPAHRRLAAPARARARARGERAFGRRAARPYQCQWRRRSIKSRRDSIRNVTPRNSRKSTNYWPNTRARKAELVLRLQKKYAAQLGSPAAASPFGQTAAPAASPFGQTPAPAAAASPFGAPAPARPRRPSGWRRRPRPHRSARRPRLRRRPSVAARRRPRPLAAARSGAPLDARRRRHLSFREHVGLGAGAAPAFGSASSLGAAPAFADRRSGLPSGPRAATLDRSCRDLPEVQPHEAWRGRQTAGQVRGPRGQARRAAPEEVRGSARRRGAWVRPARGPRRRLGLRRDVDARRGRRDVRRGGGGAKRRLRWFGGAAGASERLWRRRGGFGGAPRPPRPGRLRRLRRVGPGVRLAGGASAAARPSARRRRRPRSARLPVLAARRRAASAAPRPRRAPASEASAARPRSRRASASRNNRRSAAAARPAAGAAAAPRSGRSFTQFRG